MILVFRRALSTPSEEIEIEWPVGWRLPQAGEHVLVSASQGGFVEYVSWDLATGAVRAYLR